MNKENVELHHKQALVAGGYDKTWSLEDLRLSMDGAGEAPAKRTVERWISTITVNNLLDC